MIKIRLVSCLAACALPAYLALFGCSCGSSEGHAAARAGVPAALEAARPEAPVAPAEPEGGPLARAADPSLGRAVAASLPYLEREGRAWMEGRTDFQDGTGCVSCHQVPFALWGWHEARRAGVEAGEPRWQELEEMALGHSVGESNGRPAIFGPMLLAAGAPGEPALAEADLEEIQRQLLAQQEADGRWRARGQFPAQRRPIAETDAVVTMWILLALPEEAGPELAAARARASEWLAGREEGTSIEWLAAAMLLAARDGDARRADALAGRLAACQNDDGGWGFLAGDASDAMTTGQVLYALAIASVGSDEATSRGVASLLAGQRDDGSWTVPSRLFTTEASPAHDYVYDVWGTAWAAIGLSRVAGRASPPAEAQASMPSSAARTRASSAGP